VHISTTILQNLSGMNGNQLEAGLHILEVAVSGTRPSKESDIAVFQDIFQSYILNGVGNLHDDIPLMMKYLSLIPRLPKIFYQDSVCVYLFVLLSYLCADFEEDCWRSFGKRRNMQ
jgi:hypothetical protein